MMRIFLCVWSPIPHPSTYPRVLLVLGNPTGLLEATPAECVVGSPCVILGNLLNLSKLLSHDM